MTLIEELYDFFGDVVLEKYVNDTEYSQWCLNQKADYTQDWMC